MGPAITSAGLKRSHGAEGHSALGMAVCHPISFFIVKFLLIIPHKSRAWITALFTISEISTFLRTDYLTRNSSSHDFDCSEWFLYTVCYPLYQLPFGGSLNEVPVDDVASVWSW